MEGSFFCGILCLRAGWVKNLILSTDPILPKILDYFVVTSQVKEKVFGPGIGQEYGIQNFD